MHISEIQDSLNQMLLIKELDEAVKSKLLEKGKYIDLQKYERIYNVEDPVNQIYFLLRGMVKVASNSVDGREVIKLLLFQPATFGEQGLLGLNRREEYAEAMSDDVKLLALQMKDLWTVLEGNAELASGIVNFLGQKVRLVERRLETQIFMNAKDRIKDFIRESACQRGTKVGYERLLKRNLTQQEIANYTGTSRQTVTEVFNELKKANHIHFNRNRILIRDSFKLEC